MWVNFFFGSEKGRGGVFFRGLGGGGGGRDLIITVGTKVPPVMSMVLL